MNDPVPQDMVWSFYHQEGEEDSLPFAGFVVHVSMTPLNIGDSVKLKGHGIKTVTAKWLVLSEYGRNIMSYEVK